MEAILLGNMEKLIEKYENNPVIRGLIQLVPGGIGSSIDVVLCIEIEKIKSERLKTFYDELGNGDIVISEDLILSEDFLHCYFSTLKAVINSRRREKIQFFAKILKSSISCKPILTTDEYEEYLNILDELSYRELSILFKLHSFESKYPKMAEENDLQRSTRFWPEFVSEIVEKLEIHPDEVQSILTRLNRTGCYETFVGSYLNYTGGRGKTTYTFKLLKDLIENKID